MSFSVAGMVSANASPKASLSVNPAKFVSQQRAEQMSQPVISWGPSGKVGLANFKEPEMQRTAASNVVVTKGFSKTADSGASWRGPGGTMQQTGPLYSPLWLDSNLNLPRDRATINAWCRSFFTLNPIIRNAILLHSTYPISKLNIKCKDPRAKKLFEEMIDELSLEDICTQIAQEYWVIGEAFPYAELNEGEGKWSRIFLMNPDYVVVQNMIQGGDPILSLRPDQNLQRICTSNKASDVLQRKRLSPEIVEFVRRGQNIPLNAFNVSHISNSNFNYESRGQSIIVSCFRSLQIWDGLHEAKYVQAWDYSNPITIVKVGGATGEYKPQPVDLEYWRQLLETQTYDRAFKIITHDAVNYEVINRSAAAMDIGPDIERLTKQIMIGLLVPQVVLDGGGDTTYANGGVALDVLKGRYMQFRARLAKWLRRKIFAPIAKINDLYTYNEGKEKILILPEIEWSRMSLFDTEKYIDTLKELAISQGEGSSPTVSIQSLFEAMGRDYEEEQQKIKEEAIQAAIRKKELATLDQMTLAELRALDPKTQIEEKKAPPEDPLPGEEMPGEGLPGMEGLEAPPGGAPTGMPPGGELAPAVPTSPAPPAAPPTP